MVVMGAEDDSPLPPPTHTTKSLHSEEGLVRSPHGIGVLLPHRAAGLMKEHPKPRAPLSAPSFLGLQLWLLVTSPLSSQVCP